jgi:hypothetical protein
MLINFSFLYKFSRPQVFFSINRNARKISNDRLVLNLAIVSYFEYLIFSCATSGYDKNVIKLYQFYLSRNNKILKTE